MQLVNDRVQIWDTMKDKIFGFDEVVEKFGVRPDQIRDYLALVGDSSDNIPGVPSIGPKTAADLLREFDTLPGILKAAAAGKISGKKCQTLVEHKKDAEISAVLATVKDDLTVTITFEELKYKFHVDDRCATFLRSLDFHSLVAKWTQAEIPLAAKAVIAEITESVTITQVSATDKDTFRTVNSEKAFDELLKKLDHTKEFGFDLETTSLNPRQAEIVGVALSWDPSFGCYIPVGHRGTDVPQLKLEKVLEKLKPFLENPRFKKIGQNLKYDFSVLNRIGIKPDGIGADTMVAAYVLNPEGRHNLDTLASHYLNYNVLTFEQVCGKGKDQLGFDQVPIDLATRYSAEDAWITLKLWHELKKRLEDEKLMEIFARVDLPLVQVLSRIESNGVSIDVDWLQKLSRDFEKELIGIEQRVQAYTKGPVNLNSPKQLAQLLFEDLKLPSSDQNKETGYSTDASVLEALAPLHEIPRLLLEYREISKLKGTYVDTLPALRDATDGKIHAGFHQTVAATGRLSSSDPNLQNIPTRTERGRKFVARLFRLKAMFWFLPTTAKSNSGFSRT